MPLYMAFIMILDFEYTAFPDLSICYPCEFCYMGLILVYNNLQVELASP